MVGNSLEGVLAATRHGAGGAIVLRGEAGTGKTTLLRRAIEHAPDVRVAQVTGIESEREFGFAALHQLVLPFRHGLGRIPDPQQMALGAAFGLTSAAPPDRFMTGLGVLSLLADAAAERPVLVAVDDAQWLDDATAEVLAFVARRLRTMPVALALAVREPAPRPSAIDGLPCLRLAAGRVATAACVPDEADLMRLAWQGREAESRSAAALLSRDHTNPGRVDQALTILELGLGRYDAALRHALAVHRDGPPDLGVQIIPDLLEAATHGDRPDAAVAAARRLATGRIPLAPGLVLRSQALLAAGDAEDLYREALGSAGNTETDLARTHLVYGEWLRRRRRRRDAREQLRFAHEMFEGLGFAGFARRAAVELDATGERMGKRDAAVHDRLTAQETEVARLVAEGHSNRQVAARLFISHNTVEYHLRKVFRKIGVSSRTQLVRVLLDQAGAIRPDVAVEAG